MLKNFLLMSFILVVFSGCDYKDVKESFETKPEINSKTEKAYSQECHLACDNYVNRCLTLVPGADEVLFQDGRDSCLAECTAWDDEKVGCLGEVNNCPAMTEDCDL